MADEINQWEYRVETLGSAFKSPKDAEIEAVLNEWGESGWEILAVHIPYGSNKIKVLAKRPLTRAARRQRTWPGD